MLVFLPVIPDIFRNVLLGVERLLLGCAISPRGGSSGSREPHLMEGLGQPLADNCREAEDQQGPPALPGTLHRRTHFPFARWSGQGSENPSATPSDHTQQSLLAPQYKGLREVRSLASSSGLLSLCMKPNTDDSLKTSFG